MNLKEIEARLKKVEAYVRKQKKIQSEDRKSLGDAYTEN